MPIIIDGKSIAADILAEAKSGIAALGRKPRLAAILIGNDPASISFLNEKRKKSEAVGIEFMLYRYDDRISTTQVRARIAKLRKEKKPDAIIIQLPLPEHLNTQYVLDAVPPDEDVDGLSSRARGLLATEKSLILPPTAAAVLHILQVQAIALGDLHAVIVGLGPLVGKPLLTLLANKVASVTAVHAGTPAIDRFTKEADLLIVGTGQAGLIDGSMVKEGVIALDAGYSSIDGKISGDLVYGSVAQKARLITPVPGGIGPITVAMLLKNVVTLAKK
ncbi:MAG: bifunctional 5,10-methylenetetrahydrofolate dehydrogenase/5,10-methenyltetrahydrofolate cyclohydrolase [bacterium]|nr:bifunctional 5,10-methylenetetrahydrofolate dehydrogenase/5,10-methenyltetrahydrofolate cyclohydrolase [bacterium]